MKRSDTGSSISVGVRVRPLNKRELESGDNEAWIVKSTEGMVRAKTSLKKVESYAYDNVFDSETQTHTVYDKSCAHIIDSAFEGYNGTILCYGQTSSGKTHTMLGSSADPGVVILAVHDVFQRIKETPHTDFLVTASYLEIYNEKIIDMLCEESNESIHDCAWTNSNREHTSKSGAHLDVFLDKQVNVVFSLHSVPLFSHTCIPLTLVGFRKDPVCEA